MRATLFLLPYLVVPIVIALTRKRRLRGWSFVSYALCAALLLPWPVIWEDLHTSHPALEPTVDDLFPTLCALVLVPIALALQWLSSSLLIRARE